MKFTGCHKYNTLLFYIIPFSPISSSHLFQSLLRHLLDLVVVGMTFRTKKLLQFGEKIKIRRCHIG